MKGVSSAPDSSLGCSRGGASRYPDNGVALSESLVLPETLVASETELRITEALPIEEWAASLGVLDRASKCIQWWSGDLLRYGEQEYGAAAVSQFVTKLSHLKPESVRTYAWVCEKVPRERRRSDLTFAHHQAVARLSADEQVDALERAASYGWSKRMLTESLKEGFPEVDPYAPTDHRCPSCHFAWNGRPDPTKPQGVDPEKEKEPDYGTTGRCRDCAETAV